MGDHRRPYLLTDVERSELQRLASEAIEAGTLAGRNLDQLDCLKALGADPVPWVTTDDTGRRVRMESHGICCDNCMAPTYVPVPLNEEGGQ